MEYKVKDSDRRIAQFADGSFLIACGSDGENICGIDYVTPDGKVKYCLSFNDYNNPYAEVLARLFDKVTGV